MEKIKIKNVEYEISSISQRGNLLEIVFPVPTDLRYKNLSKIELYTAGGVFCAEITGYTVIYKVEGTKVTLSKIGSTESEHPVDSDPVEQEEPVPSALEIKLREFDTELGNISNTIVFMTLV